MKNVRDVIVWYLKSWWPAWVLCLFSIQGFCLGNIPLAWADSTKTVHANMNSVQCREPEEYSRVPGLQSSGESRGTLTKRALGMAVRVGTQQEASRFHVRQKQPLVIYWLDPSGPLASAGVEVNDVLLQINGQPLSGFEDLMNIAGQLEPRQRVVIVVLDHRTGRKGYIQVRTR